jgi:hypothetical protein
MTNKAKNCHIIVPNAPVGVKNVMINIFIFEEKCKREKEA